MTEEHKKKFAQFLLMCETMKEQKNDVLVINHPEVIGHTHEEMVANLNHMAEAGLMLVIVPSKKRIK